MTDTAKAAHETAILALLDLPALLVENERVLFANRAARELLGGHINDENIRLVLRAPNAIALILSPEGGRTRLSGLTFAGSQFDLTCSRLTDGVRLVTLQDVSVQITVARAHADFVANASHELRTPIASILGFVETLLDDNAGGNPDTRREFLTTIRGETQRMQSLVEDLMSLSRIEANKHDIPEDVVDFVAVVRRESSAAQFVLTTNSESAAVLGDASQIAQAVRNILENAVKYGTVESPVNVSIEATANGWVCLTVRNQGETIPPEHLSRLTERFYRADTGRSRTVGGTGLGLSIVKHIIERHRGRLDISSRDGHGTTVSIMLPTATVTNLS